MSKKGKRNGGGPTAAEKFSKFFDIPSDTVDGGLTLELRGRNGLLVGGCEEILEYSPERIRLRLRRGVIVVCGCRLTMTTYYRGQTGIEGEIRGIDLCDLGGGGNDGER